MKIKFNEKISWRQLGEHTIILDTVLGKKIHHLNEVGSVIWNCLQENQTKEAILSILESEFDSSHAQLSEDFDEFMQKMQKLNLLEQL